MANRAGEDPTLMKSGCMNKSGVEGLSDGKVRAGGGVTETPGPQLLTWACREACMTLGLSIWKRLLLLTAWLRLRWGLLGKAARGPQGAEFWFKMKVNDI